VVSHIDIDALYVPSNLCVDIDLLVGPEFGSHGEGSSEVCALNLGRGNDRRNCRIRAVLGGV
jgi:hypothetical protein